MAAASGLHSAANNLRFLGQWISPGLSWTAVGDRAGSSRSRECRQPAFSAAIPEQAASGVRLILGIINARDPRVRVRPWQHPERTSDRDFAGIVELLTIPERRPWPQGQDDTRESDSGSEVLDP